MTARAAWRPAPGRGQQRRDEIDETLPRLGELGRELVRAPRLKQELQASELAFPRLGSKAGGEIAGDELGDVASRERTIELRSEGRGVGEIRLCDPRRAPRQKRRARREMVAGRPVGETELTVDRMAGPCAAWPIDCCAC